MIRNATPGQLATYRNQPVVILARQRDDYRQRWRLKVRVLGERRWLVVRPGELDPLDTSCII